MISKKEIIHFIEDYTKLPKDDVDETLNALIEAITYYLSKGISVNLLNFGVFEVKKKQKGLAIMSKPRNCTF